MATTGWKTAATVVGNIGSTGPSWSNTGNTAASDNAYASLTNKSATTTRALRLRDFGFTTGDIPSGATIAGVEVEIERKAGGAGVMSDSIVQLIINSAATSADRIGSNQALGPTWPTTDTVATYGGAADVWGSSVTDAQIRAATFGLDLAVVMASGGNISVDFVRMRVHYTTLTHYTITASGGTFTETGSAATLRAGRKVAAAQGTFALTGISATLRRARRLSAVAGAFTLTGASAGLKTGRKIAAAQGTFTLSGQTAALRNARKLAAAQGAFALTGASAALVYTPIGGYTLVAAAGAFTLAGQAAGLKVARKLAASPAAFTLTGQSASLRRTWALVAGSGAFSVSGQIAGLVYGRRLPAAEGSFTLTGEDAALARTRALSAQGGQFTVSGADVTLTYDELIRWTPVAAATPEWTAIEPDAGTWSPIDPATVTWQ